MTDDPYNVDKKPIVIDCATDGYNCTTPVVALCLMKKKKKTLFLLLLLIFFKPIVCRQTVRLSVGQKYGSISFTTNPLVIPHNGLYCCCFRRSSYVYLCSRGVQRTIGFFSFHLKVQYTNNCYIQLYTTRVIASLSTAIMYYLFNVNAIYEIYSNYGVMLSAVIFHWKSACSKFVQRHIIIIIITRIKIKSKITRQSPLLQLFFTLKVAVWFVF